MDHVLPIGSWHGTFRVRKARGSRCALPARADGPPEQGMPYRTHGWLRSAQARPHLASPGGTLVLHGDAKGGDGAAVKRPKAKAATVHGATLIRGGKLIRLAPGSSESALQSAVNSRVTLLTVSLSDASSLLGCVNHAATAQQLIIQLFRVKWCWRPEEMTEPRLDPRSNATIDVCVWGLADPMAPRQCPP